MLTTRGSGLLATAVALWLASRVFGTPELQIAAVALVALVAVAVLRVWTGSTDLHADRFADKAPNRSGPTCSTETPACAASRPSARIRALPNWETRTIERLTETDSFRPGCPIASKPRVTAPSPKDACAAGA